MKERTETTTPLQTIYNKYNELQGVNPDKEFVILISTGALNPVHRMHVETFNETKRQLESEHNKIVLGAFLSPSHDNYVQTKLGKEFIHSSHRLAMCDLAVQDAGYSDWLFVDRWECECNGFVDFPQVTHSLVHYVNQIFKNDSNVKVYYLCGSDHFLKCGQLRGMRNKNQGVVVLLRNDTVSRRLKSSIVTDPKSSLYVVETNITSDDLSSTMIRELKKKKKDFSHLTFPSVVQYILQNNL